MSSTLCNIERNPKATLNSFSKTRIDFSVRLVMQTLPPVENADEGEKKRAANAKE